VPELHIRKARPSDVPAMLELINNYARTGLMLPRTEFEMCENIRDFSVALARKASGPPDGRGGPVCPPEQAGMPAPLEGRGGVEGGAALTAEHLAGCGALHFYTPQMAELRSLAVSEKLKAAGVGRKIVAALLEEARGYGLDVVFAFTYVVPFFEKCGFRVVDRGTLPLKVWKDCVRCPHFNCCDETAMVHLLRPEARAAENGHDGLVHLSSHISRWPGAQDEAIQVPRVTTGGFQAR